MYGRERPDSTTRNLILQRTEEAWSERQQVSIQEQVEVQALMMQQSATRTGHPGALIVGASTGMGAALARVLAARGYAVALIGRQDDRLAQLAGEINSGGKGQATAYPHDVRQYDAAPELFASVASDMATAGASFRLVVYTAGVMPAET